MASEEGYYVIPMTDDAIGVANDELSNYLVDGNTIIFYCKTQEDLSALFDKLGASIAAECFIVKGMAEVPAPTSVFGVALGEQPTPSDFCAVITSEPEEEIDE